MSIESGFAGGYVVPGRGAAAAGRTRARGLALKHRLFPESLDLAKPALMAGFRERPVVVLAPHFDDACFSLGGFLTGVGQGLVINIFTQGLYTARGFAPKPLNKTQVVAIRDREDSIFADRCGLERENLACEEPSLRGRQARDLSGLEDDIAQMSGPLLDVLYRRAREFEAPVRGCLFVPLAVGFHCNHHAVRELILREYGGLSQFYDIFFYEDQSYARSFSARLRALEEIGRRLDSSAYARYVYPLAWRDKRDLVSIYRSQHRRPPRALKFWPRAASPLKPHEAFWSFPLGKRA